MGTCRLATRWSQGTMHHIETSCLILISRAAFCLCNLLTNHSNILVWARSRSCSWCTHHRWRSRIWWWDNRWNDIFQFLVTASRKICKGPRKNRQHFKVQTRIRFLFNCSSLLVSMVPILMDEIQSDSYLPFNIFCLVHLILYIKC